MSVLYYVNFRGFNKYKIMYFLSISVVGLCYIYLDTTLKSLLKGLDAIQVVVAKNLNHKRLIQSKGLPLLLATTLLLCILIIYDHHLHPTLLLKRRLRPVKAKR